MFRQRNISTINAHSYTDGHGMQQDPDNRIYPSKWWLYKYNKLWDFVDKILDIQEKHEDAGDYENLNQFKGQDNKFASTPLGITSCNALYCMLDFQRICGRVNDRKHEAITCCTLYSFQFSGNCEQSRTTTRYELLRIIYLLVIITHIYIYIQDFVTIILEISD